MPIPKGYPPGTVAYDQKPSVQKFIAGFPEFAFGAYFAAMWLSPRGFTDGPIGLASQAMAIELLLVHASTLFAWRTMSSNRRSQWREILILGGSYFAFGVALSLAFKSLTPLAIIGVFAVSRTWEVFAEPPPSEFAQRYWFNKTGMNIGLYVLIAIVTTFVPIPFAGGFPGVVSWPMLWVDGWEWHVERLVFMASAFYVIRGFAIMWPWPRRLYLLPAPSELTSPVP